MVTRSPIAQRAWLLIVFAAAAAHVAIGLTFLLSDNLEGPVFVRAADVPAWVWGWWAVCSGCLILLRRTRLVALSATAAWYSLWGAVLILGLLKQHGPFHAIPVYLLLIVLHAAFAVTEWAERR